MFEDQGKDVVFMEMVRNLRRSPHCVIECIPLTQSAAEIAPMYFKVLWEGRPGGLSRTSSGEPIVVYFIQKHCPAPSILLSFPCLS